MITALLAWLAYRATGTRLSGEATTPIDIPIIGNDLSELTLTEPVTYRGFEHPHGGGTFTITGAATPDSVARFCDRAEISLSQNGTNIQGRDAILEYLEHRDVELPGAGSDAPPEVMFGMGGRFRKLYGVYDTTSHQFAITLQFDGSK